MLRKLTAVFLSLLMIAAFAPVPALAQGDTTPPVLVSVSTDKTEYVSGDTVVITVCAKDDSGLDVANSSIIITDKRTSLETYAQFQATDSPNTCVAKITVNDTLGTDDYFVSGMYISDNCNNRAGIGYDQFPSIPSFHVTNTVRSDFEGPVLTSLKVDKTTANVGDTVTFSATATDPSGVSSVLLLLEYAPNLYISSDVPLDVVTSTPGSLTGTLAITNKMFDSTYQVRCVWLYDSFGNTSQYAVDANDPRYTELPESMQCSFKVNNPAKPLNAPKPTVTNVQLSSLTVKSGDTLTLTVTMDPHGNTLNDEMIAYFGCNNATYSRFTMEFSKSADNQYVCNWPVQANLQPGDYTLERYDIFDSGGNVTQYFYDYQKPDSIYPVFHISSVFSGTDNVSIPLNSSFDKYAGVTAANDAEGDMTNRIEAVGDVDTTQAGLYLVKYRILSNQKDSSGNYYYYQDFRWVGVTEVAPDPSAGSGTLVVTDGTVKVGAAKSDVTLTRDGKPVDYAASMASAGSYIASVKGQSGSSDKAGFIIDNAGPAVTATYSIVSPTKINVSACSKDPSGVAQTKWKAGTATLADIRANGTVFNKTFTVGSFGVYTIYAKDKLGHESIKTINIKSIAVASISLNQKSAKLAVGGKLQLSAKVAPVNATFKAVTWSSSNTKVATVDASGKVKAVGAGTAIITAKAPSGKIAQCKVVVHTVVVTQVTLNKRTAALSVKGSVQLTAKVTPTNATDQKVKWTSSNTKVATVDSNGKVVAVGKGTVFIYAKSANGIFARCKITVK